MGHFIWTMAYNGEKTGKIHMVRWSQIARLVEVRGWGIIDPGPSNKALFIKNMWRVVSGLGIWSHIIKEKHIYGQSFFTWITNVVRKKSQISYNWRNMILVFQFLLGNVCWKMGDGSMIKVGLDSIISMKRSHSLSIHIIKNIHIKEIVHLKNIFHRKAHHNDLQAWYKVDDLELHAKYYEEWEDYIIVLRNVWISLNHKEDHISSEGTLRKGIFW